MWKDTKVNFREILYEGVDWMNVAICKFNNVRL
jgi:hypothetical protein